MKKFVAIVLALVFCVAACGVASAAYQGLYARSTVVVKLDYENDVVVVEDFNGNLWEFTGCEDWIVGDICSMVMYDNDTPQTIYDDEIVDVRYDGWID